MKLREISILDQEAIPAALEALHSKEGVLLLQMPAVFVLLAPATPKGVESLNQTKLRLPQKNYGTAIGDIQKFHALASPGSLPHELKRAEDLNRLTGAFIRFAIGRSSFNSAAVRAGTHQGVLVDGPHRDLFKAVEQSFAQQADPALFCGHTFSAPLCTSANLSGDSLGSITDWDRAYRFARQRHLSLVIRCEAAPGENGSYPIFYFKDDQATIERHGPGEEAIMRRLPERLFAESLAFA
ncbi:hypothetical protein [Haliscomenobacter hydrossis]|uniref:YrdC-like domain-containing protein n=1 Tax=Haliscomenobacter hydrossis (strain ATCC 27775 / DSM 1100 / LMG 10767 / O) TaxID=760192 RepID=F4L3E7_HALH1|nr:hypothetical protein [Haliscomenobacter hydrossis]AEE52924.1 hypothetical protein Halhy_5098 [Haliscomenobacter hydrossis DSM 1100]